MHSTLATCRTLGLSRFDFLLEIVELSEYQVHDFADDMDTTKCQYGITPMHDKYCMTSIAWQTPWRRIQTHTTILLGCSMPSRYVVAAVQQYGKVTIQHSRSGAGHSLFVVGRR